MFGNEDADADDDGVKSAETSFGAGPKTDDEVNQEKLEAEARHERLKAKMLAILDTARAEVEAGTLHGLAVVRSNEAHEVAAGYAVCSDAARPIGIRMQEISMDLVLPAGARRELKQLMSLLRDLG